MSRLTDSFREAEVRNPHEFYNGDEAAGQVFIAYSSGDTWHARAWIVYHIGHDISGNDSLRSGKEFLAGGNKERRAAALGEAQDWAAQRYGIKDWVRDPYGSYGEKTFVAARTKELKELNALAKAALEETSG